MATRRTIIFTLCTLAVVSVLFVLPHLVHAQVIPPTTHELIPDGNLTTGHETPSDSGSGCSWYRPFTWPTCIVAALGELAVRVLGVGLWIAGRLFDLSVYLSVANFKTFADTPAMQAAWTVSRDAANVFFIFILLYIAIGTILQLNGIDAKKMVVKVIIIALLINFSWVLTGVVIDSGNVIAFQFYKALRDGDTSQSLVQEKSISAKFVKVLAPQSNFAEPTQEERDSNGASAPSTGFTGVILRAIGQSVLIVIAAFVFFSAAILFMIRMVVLIFLMVISPFAFLAYAFPTQEGQYTKWMKTLISQTFFAPAYLFLIYLVVRIITSDGFGTFNQVQQAGFGGWGMNVMENIIKFIIVSGLMLISLVVARSMGAYGADFAEKWSKRLGGTLATNTVGRLGARMARSEGLKERAASGGMVSSRVANSLRNLGKLGAGSSFGMKNAGVGSFDDRIKTATERKNLGDYAGDIDSQKNVLARMSTNKRMQYYSGLKAEERAKLEATSIDDAKMKGVFTKLRARLPNEKERKDTEKALETAQDEHDVSEGLKMMKEKRTVPTTKDGKVARDDTTGKIIEATKEARNEELKKFVKLIKPNKDTAGAIADVLRFDSEKPEEREMSKRLVQSLSKVQLNRLLKDDVVDQMKNSDKQIEGISGSITELPDDSQLKEYVRNTPAFSALLGIKKSKDDTSSQQHLETLKKSRAEMLAEVANDATLVQLQDDLRANRNPAGNTDTERKIAARQDELILNKQKEALNGLSTKDMESLAPLLSVTDGARAHTEMILKNISSAKAQELGKHITETQRDQFNGHYGQIKVGETDTVLAKQLNALDVDYQGRPAQAASATGGAGGASSQPMVVIPIGDQQPTPPVAQPEPAIIPPPGRTPGPNRTAYPSGESEEAREAETERTSNERQTQQRLTELEERMTEGTRSGMPEHELNELEQEWQRTRSQMPPPPPRANTASSTQERRLPSAYEAGMARAGIIPPTQPSDGGAGADPMAATMEGTSNIPPAKPEVVAQEGKEEVVQELFDVGLGEIESGQTVDERTPPPPSNT